MRLSWEKAARRPAEPGPSSTLPTAHIAILRQWDSTVESSVYHLGVFISCPHEIDAKRAISRHFCDTYRLARRTKGGGPIARHLVLPT